MKGAGEDPNSESVRCANIGNVERAMVPYPPSYRRVETISMRTPCDRTRMRPQNHHIPLVSADYVVNSTNSGGTLDDRVETGCTSVGERRRMPSTSDVAV